MKKRILPLCTIMLFIFTAQPFAAVAGDVLPDAQVELQSKVNGLSLERATSNTALRGSWTWVEVKGEFERPNWSLLVGASEVSVNGNEFRTWIPLVGETTAVTIRAVGPLGQVESTTAIIHYQGVPQTEWAQEGGTSVKTNWGWVPGLSLSSLAYQQTGYSDFSQMALTAKISTGYHRAASQWDYGLTVFATALPLSSNLAGVSARFLGVNLRAGYRFPGIKEPWALTLRGGVYYTTMLVSGSTLGYTNQFGPQLYPEARYLLPKDRYVSGYFKFSPILDGIKVMSLSNREFATGATYGWKLENQHTMGVNLDYSDLAVVYQTSAAALKTISLGLSYSL